MSEKAERTGSGQCLCGAVRYQTHGTLRPVINCHCQQCGRQSGHHVAATAVMNAELSIDGEDQLSWYGSSDFAERGFCRRCGSNLFWRRIDGDYTSITVGTMDRPTGLTTKAHIYVADKSDYYDIHDDLPRHAQSDTEAQGSPVKTP